MAKTKWLAMWAITLFGLAVLTACSQASTTAECTDEPGNSCVWAGVGVAGLNGDGLDKTETRFYWPIDLEFGPDGTPWILDWNNHLIRRVNSDGTLETIVGEFVGDGPDDGSDETVDPGLPGETIRLNHPTDMVFGPDGNIYIAAWHNHKLRRLDPTTGLVKIVAGSSPGYDGDGETVGETLLNQPKGLVFDADGNIYVLDQRNQRVRKVFPDGTVTTVVGTGEAGFSGDGGPPAQAQVNFESGPNPNPSGALAMDSKGLLYIADGLNYRIRRVDFDRGVIETIAGTGEKGFSGDEGSALKAQISTVNDLEFGPDGRLYFADTENHCVRAIDLKTGIISMVWDGKGEGPGLKGRTRYLDKPWGIAFDKKGHLYIADTFNSRILRITLAG